MTHENILNLSIENRIEIIRNYIKQIESDKITILTGSNDSSKSLIQHKPEIDMSKESQLGLASYLKENKNTILHNSKKCASSHSEFLVKELESIFTFLNMDEYETVDKWINRTIIPTDFNVLQEKLSKLLQRLIKNKHH